MTNSVQAEGWLQVYHKNHCAVYDPTPSHCDCSSRQHQPAVTTATVQQVLNHKNAEINDLKQQLFNARASLQAALHPDGNN